MFRNIEHFEITKTHILLKHWEKAASYLPVTLDSEFFARTTEVHSQKIPGGYIELNNDFLYIKEGTDTIFIFFPLEMRKLVKKSLDKFNEFVLHKYPFLQYKFSKDLHEIIISPSTREIYGEENCLAIERKAAVIAQMYSMGKYKLPFVFVSVYEPEYEYELCEVSFTIWIKGKIIEEVIEKMDLP